MKLKLFGLRFNRRFEWLSIVKSEGRRVGWGSILVSFVCASTDTFQSAVVGQFYTSVDSREDLAGIELTDPG